ncbi:helix-turn-helix transcriptional regulator [Ornithinimicrobium sp. INDO-MA30-4]|uniref:helix-turn-helix domain-containing protein n=1 Tax=Ornithinimicrobium sp. INDO-MA30-4 TaxID=2908651 RepID=UPI001F24E678|nr:helix-turn-helix transcriptional regulator [Ornithinimicrobium sp. INDO-MA30-4]UJH71783.1 helix-turn-helix domain-containing protein [Ornithinimicrobium sp. INDO-MA30-4]
MFDRPTIRPDALRHAREAAGLTQHQLAVRLDLSGGERVSSWELGRAQPSLRATTKPERRPRHFDR